MTLAIASKIIGPNYPSFIIAEAGVNHNGQIDLAIQLIDAAIKAGADAVKFQTFSTDNLVRHSAPKANYQNKNIGHQKSQYEMLSELELEEDRWRTIIDYCKQKGIIFLSTPYDTDSIAQLYAWGVPAFKLASIDLVTHPFIQAIASLDRPLLLSTGMATISEIAEAVKVYASTRGSTDGLALLQANTNYPAPLNEQNLAALPLLAHYVNVVGFSDHTSTSTAALIALGLGARIFERHITLDKTMAGPDHTASSDPVEFAQYVQDIRQAELAMGSADKKPTSGEQENMVAMRRSICAKQFIPKGGLITMDTVAFKRPGNGMYPTLSNLQNIIDKRARRDIEVDENIMPEMFY